MKTPTLPFFQNSKFTIQHSLVIVALTFFTPAAALADDDEPPRTISVSGEGKVTATPDMATISTGVTTNDITAKAALDANSSAMEALMKTLTDAGIEERDIQTSGFNVSPQYNRTIPQPGQAAQRPKIVGYQVSNNVRVRIRDLDQLGPLLDQLVEAGSNQLGGVSFSIADPEPLLNDARDQAVRKARERADLYAKAAGVKVGKVLSISEASVGFPRPQPMQQSLRMAAAESVPVAPGEQEIRANINIVYEIADE
ncbi:MAG: SIMPL domain-containing protein [Verrucomicrobiota bacterium]